MLYLFTTLKLGPVQKLTVHLTANMNYGYKTCGPEVPVSKNYNHTYSGTDCKIKS